MKNTTLPIERNRLLAALPAAMRARLRAEFEPVTMERDKILYRPGQPLRYVYFPLNGFISKLYLSADGAAASIGLIGSEGMIGLTSFLGGLETTSTAHVIETGTALRLSSHVLEREFEQGGEFQRVLLLFAQAFMAQAGQIAVCNRHHSLSQQLCFWLLLCFERVTSNELRITQETLAGLLGVRREGITRAALKLKEDGLLDYRRGRVIVPELEPIRALSCECYRIVHDAYATLLPAPAPVAEDTTVEQHAADSTSA